MKRKILTLVVAACLVGSTAFAAKVNTDWDPRIDFSKYSTFTFEDNSSFEESVVTQVIFLLITETLQKKGLKLVLEGEADLRVAVIGAIGNDFRIENYAVSYAPYGGWGGWYGTGWSATAVGVRDITVGTVLVDLVDDKTNELVWRSVAHGTIDEAANPDKRVKRIERVIAKMFKKFPPQ